MTNARAIALEAVVAIATAALFLVSCLLIRVYPLDRLGQISGLASLAFRFVLFSLVLIAALVLAKQKARFELTTRLVCAAIAGLASGFVAGGLMVSLHGTPWGLNGQGGDIGALANWATALHRGESIPPMYPPLSVHVLHLYSDVMNVPPGYAIKDLQILGTAAFGPFAYLSWRLLVRAPWALAIGVVAMLPMIEQYKPFPNLVLVAFVPLALAFLDTLRGVASRNETQIATASLGYGLAFGVMCLLYSGWFQWAAPGLFVATLVVFPWRAARRKGLYLLALTAVVFLLLGGHYVFGLLFDPASKIMDKYIYFDVKVDPMYIAMWRNDTPGIVDVWPPLGELGGVGLFTIMLAVGFGAAVALGRKTTAVIGLTAIMVGAFFMRFLYARHLWDTKLVQLYPRTTPLILYCLLVLAGLAVRAWVERLAADHPLRGRSGVIGAVCALLLFFASAGSASADRYMPLNTDPPGAGWLAYNAHRTNWGYKQRVYKASAMPWIRRGDAQ